MCRVSGCTTLFAIGRPQVTKIGASSTEVYKAIRSLEQPRWSPSDFILHDAYDLQRRQSPGNWGKRLRCDVGNSPFPWAGLFSSWNCSIGGQSSRCEKLLQLHRAGREPRASHCGGYCQGIVYQDLPSDNWWSMCDYIEWGIRWGRQRRRCNRSYGFSISR